MPRRWRIFGGKGEDPSSSRLAMLVSVPGPSSTNPDPVAEGGFAILCRPASARHDIAGNHRAKTCFSPLIRCGRLFSTGKSVSWSGLPLRMYLPPGPIIKIRYGNMIGTAKHCDSPPQITYWGYANMRTLTCTQVVSSTAPSLDRIKLSRMKRRLRRKECYVRFWL